MFSYILEFLSCFTEFGTVLWPVGCAFDNEFDSQAVTDFAGEGMSCHPSQGKYFLVSETLRMSTTMLSLQEAHEALCPPVPPQLTSWVLFTHQVGELLTIAAFL